MIHKLLTPIAIAAFFCFDFVHGQNIGINTDGSAGVTLLHTKNTAAATDNILRIENTIGNQKSGINFLNSTTANANWLFYIPASSTSLRLQLYTGTDAVTFLNNGNVGIGTTTPGAKLQISGSADATQLIILANVTQSNTNLVSFKEKILHLQ